MRRHVPGAPSMHARDGCALQMEEEGVPSTTLREVSLLKMLSESNHIVKCVAAGCGGGDGWWGGVMPGWHSTSRSPGCHAPS